jgi:transcriptional regulator of acetoin/glycerol metabolism
MAMDKAFDVALGDESHADRVYSVSERAPPIAGVEEVSASWRRCLTEFGVDPGSGSAPQILTARELTEAREPVEALVAAAKDENERLHDIVGKVGYCVLFTTTDGVVIDFRGDPARTDELKYWGIWKGGVWSENVEGTNGIGTCVAEERPITVHRTQHFRSRHTNLSCCGAPVFGPDGKLAAVLDVTSIDPEVSERSHAMALVVTIDSAHNIEDTLFRERYNRAWCVFAAAPTADRRTLNLAVDEDLQIVGAGRSARMALGLDDRRLATGVSLWDLFEHSPLYLSRAGDIKTTQLRRKGAIQPWPALIVPPRTSAPETRHALLQAHLHLRHLESSPNKPAAAHPGYAGHATESGAIAQGEAALSSREAAILELVAKGFTNKQIARQLAIAPETVKTHVKHVFTKLGVARRAQAVMKAQGLGLITPL